MTNIDYRNISWESFEDLCSALWFDEGYTNIQPYGRYREGGRDAIFYDADRDELVIFQYKRWTGKRSPSKFKKAVKEAIEKIREFNPQKYILNSALESSASINDWVRDKLDPTYDFKIEYWDRSWVDLRLNNRRQDLRRECFGIELERHTWSSLLPSCREQVEQAIRATGQKYIPELYVERRKLEADFASFLESDKSCFVIVDSSGSGKTNLLCHLAETYSKSLPVLLLSGRRRIQGESGLIMQITNELGYAGPVGTRWQHGIEDVIRFLDEEQSIGIIFIDGVSESDDIILMKRSVYELLTRYGETRRLKICLTCRDTLWHRFSIDFPAHLVYRSGVAGSNGEISERPISIPLGNWTDDEFGEAMAKYQRYFAIEFALTPNAAHRCKYPLILRLLCEAYSGKVLGTLDYLPTNKVFQDYLDRKTHAVADYFDLGVEPSSVYNLLLKLRAALWSEHDTRSMPKARALEILSGLGLERAIYTRLLDEGILIEFEDDSLAESSVGFLFDELGDYLLYRHFMAQSPDWHRPTQAMIAKLCSSIQSASIKERADSEEFLELLARNLEEVDLQEYLLEQTLERDLYVFAECADQKLAIPNIPDEPEQRAYEFANRLLNWYWRIVQSYFPNLRRDFDPYFCPESDQKIVGIELYASPNFREVSYSYKTRNTSQKRIRVKLTDEYPTFYLSLKRGEKELKLHDPGGGFMIPILRGPPEGVRRTLNFEFNSPFPGVSMYAPERIAKHDVWNELTHIVGKHWLREPIPLIHERTVTLINELRREGLEITTAESIEKCRKEALSGLPLHSPQYTSVSVKLDRLEHYLTVLDDTYDLAWLPQPDSDEGLTNSAQAQWLRYSDDLLRQYLGTLLLTFMKCYWGLVHENFPNVSNRMNLYQQWPVSVVTIAPGSRSYMRIVVMPESKEDEVKLHVNVLPVDSSLDVAIGMITADDGIPVSQYVDEILHTTGRISTKSHLIDILLPMDILFGENPLNHLTYNWVKAELAEILQIPFRFWE
jgi:hypothetical protein